MLGGDVGMVGVVSDRLSCAGVWSGLFMNDAVLLAYRKLSERLRWPMRVLMVGL